MSEEDRKTVTYVPYISTESSFGKENKGVHTYGRFANTYVRTYVCMYYVLGGGGWCESQIFISFLSFLFVSFSFFFERERERVSAKRTNERIRRVVKLSRAEMKLNAKVCRRSATVE